MRQELTSRQQCRPDPREPASEIRRRYAHHDGAGIVHRLGVRLRGTRLRAGASSAGRTDRRTALAARLAADPGCGAGRLEHNDLAPGQRDLPVRRQDLVHQRGFPGTRARLYAQRPRDRAAGRAADELHGSHGPGDALAQKAKLPHRFVLGDARPRCGWWDEWPRSGRPSAWPGAPAAWVPTGVRCSGSGPPWGRASGCWCRPSGGPPGWQSHGSARLRRWVPARGPKSVFSGLDVWGFRGLVAGAAVASALAQVSGHLWTDRRLCRASFVRANLGCRPAAEAA